MKVEEIINELGTFNEEYPEQAIKEARKNKEEITEVLLDSLKYINSNAEKMYEGSVNNYYYLFMYALFLLSEFREKRAFPIIIEILKKDRQILEYLLGDALTEDVNKIIASTFDGNMDMLCEFIENREFYSFARGAALRSFHILLNQKVINRDFLVEYIEKLLKSVNDYDIDFITDDDIDFITEIAGFICDGSLYEFQDQMKELYDKNMVDPMMFGDYTEYLKNFNYPARDKEYITDTIKEMSWWYCFNQDRNDRFNINTQIHQGSSIVKTNKIGRNEPCPCGSGKKYKKCCIDKKIY